MRWASGAVEEFDAKRKAIFFLKSDLDQSDAALRLIATSPDESFGVDGLELIRLCGDALSRKLTLRDLKRLGSQGTLHRLFLASTAGGYEMVFRTPIFRDMFFGYLMQLEYHVMEIVRSHGVAIPTTRLLEVVGPNRHYTVHAAHFVENPPLSMLDEDEGVTETFLGSVSALLRRLHGINGVGYGPISLACANERNQGRAILAGVHGRWDDYIRVRLDQHIATCRQIGAVSSAEAEQISTLFDKARDELASITNHSVLHGDPGSQNFLVIRNEVSAVLDWEDCLIGDPVFDIACLATFHPHRRFPAIFSGYGWTLPPQSRYLRRFWLYFLRIALAKSVHRHRFGYVDRPGRFPGAKRIQLALERLAA